MDARPSLAALALVVLLAATAGPVASAPASPVHHARLAADAPAMATSGDEVVMPRTTTLSLTPDTPGEIRAVVRFSVPDNVRSITIRPPPLGEVTGTDGFEAAGDGSYEWSGDTDSPALTVAYDVNRTGTLSRQRADGSLSFADAGPWAISPVPGFTTRWTWWGDPSVTVERETVVDGEGTVGSDMAYLGPFTDYTRRAGDQRFRLVVPAAADLRASPERVLDSLANASTALRVGERDPKVVLIAAPTGPDWSARGLQRGDADAWVVADATLAEADNVWLHEYVHTRQGFDATPETRWLVEGSAEYYAALLTLEQGNIGFREFRTHLEAASRYDDAVLADPSTWRAGAPYFKGALVAGDLDRRLRADSDGSARFSDVLRRLNAKDEPITHQAFLDAVGAAGTADARAAADRYVTTTALPDTWSYTTHQRIFGADPARMRYTFGNGTVNASVSGPYRNATLAVPATLVENETLTVPVVVTNVGGEAGRYNVTFTVDGTVVDAANGTLAPDEQTTVPLSHAFTDPGEYAVRVGPEAFGVAVRDPARATVTDVSVPERVAPGEGVTVRATVRNDGALPGRTVVRFTVDDRVVARRTVALPAGGERTVSTTVSLAAGTHAVGANGHTAPVEAGTETTVAPGLPGFTVSAALLALLLGWGLSRSRSNRGR